MLRFSFVYILKIEQTNYIYYVIHYVSIYFSVHYYVKNETNFELNMFS